MEILTLLKANIRYKKGAFKSIIILTLIITASMAAIINTNDNIHKNLSSAITRVEAGDLIAWLNPSQDNASLYKTLDENKNISSYRIEDTLITNHQNINGNELTGQSYGLMKWSPVFCVYNEKLTEFTKQPEALKSGEAYVPVSFASLYHCKTGSKIEIITKEGTHTLTIKGFVEEPVIGAYMIGIKNYFISDEDYQLLEDEKADNNLLIPYKQIHIFQKEDHRLTTSEFKKSVNESSGIIDGSFLSMTKETCMSYTTTFTDVLSGILYVFMILLFIIVIVMICHSISSGIEMDYTNLGILKAIGFSKRKMRIVYILQYLLAQFIGIVLGLLLSYPISLFLGRIFLPITGILPGNKISALKILLITLLMILLVYVSVLLLTKKVNGISPVRAISGGQHPIYFNSHLTLAIRKKTLSFTLAFRQFTSNKKHYIGTLMISAILVFFMMSINVLIGSISSDGILGSFGIVKYDIEAYISNPSAIEQLDAMKENIKKIAAIEQFTTTNSDYITLDGSDIHCTFYTDPTNTETSLLKGRCPLYDNEFIITELIAEEYNLHIGDTITLSFDTQSADYIISGIYQSTYDLGFCIAMSYDAYKKIGDKYPWYIGIQLVDDTFSNQVISMLNDTYPDWLEAEAYSDDSMMEIIDDALIGIGILIYSISILFTFVAVNMVCKRSFIKERISIGIYKAMGFTIKKLRLQFALRFLTVALFGSLLGILLCITCCKPMLELLLRNMGITNFITEYTLSAILIPAALTGSCFFVFSYLISRKIKNVSVRELIIE